MRRRPSYYPNDGYTIPAFIDGIEGMYEPLRFTYRPVGLELQAQWDGKLEGLNGLAEIRKRAELLADRIVTWDLETGDGAKGAPVPKTAKTVTALQPSLFWKVWGIVTGRAATDIDPRWPDETLAEEIDVQADASESGLRPGETRDARDAKN